VHFEFSRCPNINTVGKWVQQTIHEAGGVSRQQKDKRVSTQAFANEKQADHLYAAFTSVPEMGGRDYWLLLTRSKAKKAKQAIRVVEEVMIRKDQYYVMRSGISAPPSCRTRRAQRFWTSSCKCLRHRSYRSTG
jgi:hypothetical protein